MLLLSLISWCTTGFFVDGIPAECLILVCKIAVTTSIVLSFAAIGFACLGKHCDKIEHHHSVLQIDHQKLKDDFKAMLTIIKDKPNLKVKDLIANLEMQFQINRLS